MSRYELACHRPGHFAVVGWDNPLRTFFAEVFRARGDRRTSVVWIGAHPLQIQRAEELIAPLAAYVALDAAILERLRNDRVAALDRGPTTLQRSSLVFMTRGGS